jgi:hypothetical protein
LADPERSDLVRSTMSWAYELGPSLEKTWPFGKGNSGEAIARVLQSRFKSTQDEFLDVKKLAIISLFVCLGAVLKMPKILAEL